MKKADDVVPPFTDGKSKPIALIGLANIRITEKDLNFSFLLISTFRQSSNSIDIISMSHTLNSLTIFNLHLTVT